jgi:hypothetical protein
LLSKNTHRFVGVVGLLCFFLGWVWGGGGGVEGQFQEVITEITRQL